MRFDGLDATGRKRPIETGETAIVECSSIILAIGEKVDGDLARSLDVRLGRGDRIEVDGLTLQTSRHNVFAAGDVVNGPTNVVTAMGSGKRAARAVDRLLTGSDRVDSLRPAADYPHVVPVEPAGGPRHAPRHLTVKKRKGSFDEVTRALDGPAAGQEALRCLRCDVKAVPEAAAASVRG